MNERLIEEIDCSLIWPACLVDSISNVANHIKNQPKSKPVKQEVSVVQLDFLQWRVFSAVVYVLSKNSDITL